MKMIVKTLYGSKLFGTATEDSDTDIKGVYMPTRKQIYLNNIPATIPGSNTDNSRKNTATDVDVEYYSLHYFFKLACKGDTSAIDMLHAPEFAILKTSDIWNKLVKERHRFYTSDMTNLVKYARTQAIKYSIRGDRAGAIKKVLDFCKQVNYNDKLFSHWSNLPTGNHIVKHNSSIENGIYLNTYEVCNRKFHSTITIKTLKDTMEKIYENYGKRAHLAELNNGIDHKAISHAFRAGFQMKEILEHGTITFPLKQAKFLIQVKTGKLDYESVLAPALNFLVDDVEVLSAASKLPKEIDKEYLNNFLYELVKECLNE